MQASAAQADRRDEDRERGFTLVEMLVVLAIIGMVTALVGPQVIGYLGRAKADTARVEVENIGTALDLFRLDVGRYPTEQEGLQSLFVQPQGLASWHGPYLRKLAIPTDPWGHPYVYRAPGRHGPYDLYAEKGEADGQSQEDVNQGAKSW
jgi:general secretion pathway protein G